MITESNLKNTKLTFKKVREPVLCLDRAEVIAQLGDTATNPNTHGVFPFSMARVHRNSFHFMNRALVDDQNTIGTLQADIAKAYPQINGYILVRKGNEVLRYTREQSGEDRLLNKDSIGFGGHSDAQTAIVEQLLDANGKEFQGINYLASLSYTALLELQEELGLELGDVSDLNIVYKLIVDNTPNLDTPTELAQGQVHIGYLMEVWIDDTSSIHATPEAKNLKWMSVEELKADDSMFYESWSKILINQYL